MPNNNNNKKKNVNDKQPIDKDDESGDVEMTPAPTVIETTGPLGISTKELFNRGSKQDVPKVPPNLLPNVGLNVGSNVLPNIGSNTLPNVRLNGLPNLRQNVGSNGVPNVGLNIDLNGLPNIGSMIGSQNRLSVGTNIGSLSNININNIDLKAANNIDNDWLSKRFRTRGIGDFNVIEHSVEMIQKYHGNIHEPLKMKMMSIDPSLKSGECFGQKFNPKIGGLPRMIMGDMIQEHLRKLMNIGLSPRDAFEHIVCTSILIDEFVLQYDTQAGLECAQRMGGKLSFGICQSNLDIVQVVHSSIIETEARHKKLYGFDKTYNLPTNKNYNKNKKYGNIDMSQYKDKTSTLYVPPGYCIFHHRLARGCNRGAKCNHKHSMWTAAELEAAKK